MLGAFICKLTRAVRVLLSVILATVCPCPLLVAINSFIASFEFVGGAHRMFREGIDHPALKIGVRSIDGAVHELTIALEIEDIFGKTFSSRDEKRLMLPNSGEQVESTIPFEAGTGYFSIQAQFADGLTNMTRWLDLGIVPPPFPGPRPDSLFASNTSELKHGEDLDFISSYRHESRAGTFHSSSPDSGSQMGRSPAAKPAGGFGFFRLG
jgi:hypothetical protein